MQHLKIQSAEDYGLQVKAVILDRIGEASSLMNSSNDWRISVHLCRKRIKEIRATLKLCRKEIGEKVYQEINQYFRSIASSMASLRDLAVMAKTLDSMIKILPAGLHDNIEMLREVLGNILIHEEEKNIAKEKLFDKNHLKLTRAEANHEAIAKISISHNALKKALLRSLKKAQKTYHTLITQPDDIRFHELRKRVKTLWFQSFIAEIVVEEMISFHHAMDQLGELLGDHHDLAVLLEEFENGILKDVSFFNKHELITFIVQQKKSLEEKIIPLAKEKIFLK